MRTLLVTVVMLVLLSACGAVESGSPDTPAGAASQPAAAADTAASSAAAPEPSAAAVPSTAAATTAPEPSAAEEAAASAAPAEDPAASSTLDIGQALDLAASAIAEASAANVAAGPTDDGCPSGMTQAHAEKSSLGAIWNPDGTITVKGGLDVPADADLMMFTYQDGAEVGWALFGSYGMLEMTQPFEQTSTIPEADDMIYGEMAKQTPYTPGSLVCVALMAIPGDASVDDLTNPDKAEQLLLTRVRLPVSGDAPAEIVLK